MKGSTVEVREVYKLVEDSRKEIMTEVVSLRTQVNSMQTTLTSVQIQVGSTNGKFSMVPILISVTISAFGIIVNFILFFGR